jgi:hypothetical protein
MGIEANGNKASVAIELELTLKNQGRIKEIVRRYQEKKDLSAVWYIAESKSILNSLFREWINYQGINKLASTVFYLRTLLKIRPKL